MNLFQGGWIYIAVLVDFANCNSCENDGLYFDSKCYYLVCKPGIFFTAQKVCQNFYNGRLATPENADDRSALLKAADRCFRGNSIWISPYQNALSDHRHRRSRETATQMFKQAGIIRRHELRKCVTQNVETSGWAVVSCSSKYPFICESIARNEKNFSSSASILSLLFPQFIATENFSITKINKDYEIDNSKTTSGISAGADHRDELTGSVVEKPSQRPKLSRVQRENRIHPIYPNESTVTHTDDSEDFDGKALVPVIILGTATFLILMGFILRLSQARRRERSHSHPQSAAVEVPSVVSQISTSPDFATSVFPTLAPPPAYENLFGKTTSAYEPGQAPPSYS